MTQFDLKGRFKAVIHRADGTEEELEFSNIVVREGKNYLLRAGIVNEISPITSWYVGLIGTNYTPQATDTASTALGASGSYNEITSYNPASRPAYVGAFVASPTAKITNTANQAVFTFTSSTTVYGVFICSNSTKGSSSGTLFCAGLFSSARSVQANDGLSVTYEVMT